VKDWKETSRYDNKIDMKKARALYKAATARHGVLAWLKCEGARHYCDISGHGGTNRHPRSTDFSRVKSLSRVISVTPDSRHDAASRASCTNEGWAEASHPSFAANVANARPAVENASTDGAKTRLTRAK
jgi:hypothetical protein